MITYSFQVLIPEGLHARPCAKLIEILKPYEPVSFSYNSVTINILSILELLLLKVGYGCSLAINTLQPLPAGVLEDLKKVFEG
ncbi:MAG: HPr family phosphocarrier protein [Proteobacteria bacterium]|nr:HPr family phosphocarrier protein [Pseudomonadota bacterium]